MSTRSTIALVQIDTKTELHIFYDLDGVHFVQEVMGTGYEYLQDIRISKEQWEAVKRQMIEYKEFKVIKEFTQ